MPAQTTSKEKKCRMKPNKKTLAKHNFPGLMFFVVYIIRANSTYFFTQNVEMDVSD